MRWPDPFLAITTTLTALAAVTLPAPGRPAGAAGGEVAQRLAAARGGAWRAPSSDEAAAARQLFRRLLDGAAIAGQAAAWRELGYELEEVAGEGGPCRVLTERSGRRHGRGFFAVAATPRRSLLLQAPHTGADLHTGELALALLAEGPAAAAWNTAPRRQVDLARQTPSFFQALAQAFADAHPRGRLLQLHGFDAAHRATTAGRRLEVIVSDGTHRPPPPLRAYAGCLAEGLGARAGLFPDDIGELGGTTNVQGRALRAARHGGFVHLELSLELRRRLRADAALASWLVRCLP